MINNEKIDSLIDDLMECYLVTTQMLPYCLEMGGEHSEARHMTTMMETAKLSHLAAELLLMGSVYGKAMTQICADACETCTVSCRNMKDDENMAACADICDKCAKSCREIQL